jgi:hypothetical protein
MISVPVRKALSKIGMIENNSNRGSKTATVRVNRRSGNNPGS